jgi:hypothetical protein
MEDETECKICGPSTRQGSNLLLHAFQATAGIIVGGRGSSWASRLSIVSEIQHLHGMDTEWNGCSSGERQSNVWTNWLEGRQV